MEMIRITYVDVILIIVLISQAASIRFLVPSNGQKCLKEEIHKDVVVTGSYEFADSAGHINSVHVCYLFSQNGKC